MKKHILTQWSGFTNHPELWYKLGLYKTNSALWVVYHVDYSLFVPSNNTLAHDSVTPITIEDDLKVTRSWTESPYIFIIDAEGRCADWVTQKDNLYVWDSTFYQHPRFNTYLWWFCEVVKLETRLHMTKKLDSNIPKPKIFDVLLGRYGRHREYVYKTLHSKQLLNSVIMSYSGACLFNGKNSHTEWVEGSTYDTNMKSTDSTETIVYDNTTLENANVSCFLPWKIYNETYYTVVTETTFKHVFLTEKTAKPILAMRLFIMVGAHGTLSGLRSLGFKTFGDVIDESYDDEKLNKKRWAMALDQLDFLCSCDPTYIEQKIKHVVKHNKELLMDKFTHNTTYTQITDILNKR